MSDVSYRLRRLFNPSSGRCLDIAVDHGFFGEKAFLQGIEDLPAAVDTLVAASPDAIQLTVGQARLLQQRGGRSVPRSSCAPTWPTCTEHRCPTTCST